MNAERKIDKPKIHKLDLLHNKVMYTIHLGFYEKGFNCINRRICINDIRYNFLKFFFGESENKIPFCMNSMNCLLYRYPVKRTVHEVHANGDFALTQQVNCDTACQTQHDVVTSWLGGSLSITCMWVFDAKRVFLEDQMLILNDLERHSKKLRASGHEVLESERGKKLRENSIRL